MPKTRSQKAKGSRDKGKVGEREVVHLLTEYGFEARRSAPMQAAVQQATRGEGIPEFPDVIALELEDDYMEVRRRESASVQGWCVGTEARAGDRNALVVWRKSRNPWRVAMSFRRYLALRAELRDARARIAHLEDELARARWNTDTATEDH